MKVAIGSDHSGFKLKTVMTGFLLEQGYEIIDKGTNNEEPADYPDFSRAVAEAVLNGEALRGILICGSGVGACVAANKFPGIRAAVCHDSFSAHQGVEDDDMNVLCLGARIIGTELAKEISLIFLKASFSKAVRHIRRLEKIRAIEKEYQKL